MENAVTDTKPAPTGCCVCSSSSLVLFQKPTSQLTLEGLLSSPRCLLKEGEIPSLQQVQAFLNFVQNLNLRHSGVKLLQPCKVSPGLAIWNTKELLLPSQDPEDAGQPQPNSPGPATFLSSHHGAAPASLSSCSLKVTWQTKTFPEKKNPLSSSLLFLGSMPAQVPLCCTDNSSLPLIIHSHACRSQRKAQTHMDFPALKVFCKAQKAFGTEEIAQARLTHSLHSPSPECTANSTAPSLALGFGCLCYRPALTRCCCKLGSHCHEK